MNLNLSSRLLAFALTMMLGAAPIYAESPAELPVKVVNGQRYHYYEVKPKDTIYSLTKRFGITTDDLYQWNPQVRDGLKAFDTLLFPENASASAAAVASAQPANGVQRHKVVKGETITGIGRKYGVTTAQLFEWNPGSRDGIRSGEYLYVSDPNTIDSKPDNSNISLQAADETTASATAEPGYISYIVKERETFYSIARAHGLTIAQLEQANPNVGVLHTGDIIRIPAINDPQPAPEVAVAEPEATVAEPEEVVAVEDSTVTEPTIAATTEPQRPGEINIALVLNLQHRQNPQSKQAQLNTEYLKGFLIAVDSMRNTGSTINLSVFDTYGSIDTLQSIITRPEFTAASMVVAPESETHLAVLADYARHSDAFIFNPFVVRDDSFTTNEHMMQANIPQQQMYTKAIDGLITRYAHYRPVFIGRTDGPNDKESFITELKERLTTAGIEYSDLTFENRPNRSDINALPSDRPLLFIPVSGRQPEANRIFPVLVDFKSDGNDVMVFGYPEWTTFRGETLSNMHELNTVVYSRFFMAANDAEAENLDGRFVYWYGAPMSNVLPRQGLLGFDSGMFLIKAFEANGGDFSIATTAHRGVQNSFHFVVPDGCKGMINDALYFINYRPGEIVDHTLL